MKVILVILILAFVGLYVILGMLRRITRMFMGEEPRQQQKVISKDEGEYVDYEEIK